MMTPEPVAHLHPEGAENPHEWMSMACIQGMHEQCEGECNECGSPCICQTSSCHMADNQ